MSAAEVSIHSGQESSLKRPAGITPAKRFAESRVLIIFDRNSGELIFGAGHAAPLGIVYLRLAAQPGPELEIRLRQVLADESPFHGAMAVVTNRGPRIRRFPKR